MSALLALVLLPLKDFYYTLIAIRLGTAPGVKTVGQPIDKLLKYWWNCTFSSDENAQGFVLFIIIGGCHFGSLIQCRRAN